MLFVSLVISAVITALQGYIDAILLCATVIISTLNTILSLILLSILFAAIYKIPPGLTAGAARCGLLKRSFN